MSYTGQFIKGFLKDLEGEDVSLTLIKIHEALDERFNKLADLNELVLRADIEIEKTIEEVSSLIEEGRWLSNNFSGREL